MTVAMKRVSDCGPVAMANHLEAALGASAADTYNRIMSEFKFPNTDGIVADFWDSPPRHIKVLERITGQKVGLVDDLSYPGPCVVLLMISFNVWHWVSLLPGGLWHDGKQLRNKTFSEAYPGCRVVMAYAVGASGPLPWYWSLWWGFTKIIAGGV